MVHLWYTCVQHLGIHEDGADDEHGRLHATFVLVMITRHANWHFEYIRCAKKTSVK